MLNRSWGQSKILIYVVYNWYNINKYCLSIHKNGSKISFKGTFEVNEAYSARTILISKSFQLQKKIFFEYIEVTTVLYLINAWNWLGHPETWWIYYFTSYGIFIYFFCLNFDVLVTMVHGTNRPLGASWWEICWFIRCWYGAYGTARLFQAPTGSGACIPAWHNLLVPRIEWMILIILKGCYCTKETCKNINHTHFNWNQFANRK